MVYRVALAYCGNAHDASDVFQNTFLKRHLHSGTFTDAKLLGMQQVLKPLSDKQLLDLAAYINKM